MRHDELVANAMSEDLAVVVEGALRLHQSTRRFNVVLIVLSVVLVLLTLALV